MNTVGIRVRLALFLGISGATTLRAVGMLVRHGDRQLIHSLLGSQVPCEVLLIVCGGENYQTTRRMKTSPTTRCTVCVGAATQVKDAAAFASVVPTKSCHPSFYSK